MGIEAVAASGTEGEADYVPAVEKVEGVEE